MGRLALGMGDQYEDLQHTASSSQEFQGEEEAEGSQGDQEITECKSAQTDPWVLQSIAIVGVAGDPIEHDSTRVKDALGQPQPVEQGVGGHQQSDDQGVTDKSQARESVCLGMPHLGEQGVMGQPQVKTLEVIDQSAGQKEVTGLSQAEDQGFIGHYYTVEQGVFDESHIGEQGVRGYSQVTDQGVIHCCHVGQPRVIDCSVGHQEVCAPHREGVRVEAQDFQWTPVQEVTPARTVDSETKQCQPGAGMFTHTQDAQGGTIGSPKTKKRQSVFCTVYCVENDFSDELPPLPPTEQGTMSEGPIKSSQPVNGELTLSPASLELELSPFLINSRGDSLHKVLMSCRVCLEDKPIKPLPCCKKGVCEDCLKRYLSSQVQLGQVEIKCPITECDKHLDESTILYSLPHDDIIKYKYFLELSHMDSSTKPCPQCKHFTIFKRKSHIPTPTKSENKFKIQCPSCQFVWCFKCHSPWHEGVNCREYKKGDKLLRHWANEIEHGQRNAQKCPRCKVHIQRTEGCDHMTCSQCNTNFCYRCGERYRQLRFFGDHTSNLSIFGCKYRYLPERPHVRRLVRGSVCAGKLLIAPLLLVLGIALGAIAVVIGIFGLPVYCLCKKQRKRTRTGMPW